MIPADTYPTCPVCGAAPGERCRATTTGRTTDTHQARIARRGNHPDLTPEPNRPTEELRP